MFFTTSGSTFEIGVARPDWRARMVSAADFTGEVWTPVAGLSSLGKIAGEWATDELLNVDRTNPDAAPMMATTKTVRPTPSMQIVAGVLSNDPGQTNMLAAEQVMDAFAFRLTLPSAEVRRFIALVLAADHVFDEANAVVCWSFTLKLQSNVYRGA